MILTNKHNLPEVLANFARAKRYDRGDASFSITQLINSPRIVAYEKRYAEQIEQDLSDLMFSLLGNAVHAVLDSYSDQNNVISEQRLFCHVNGFRISGQIDRQVLVPGGRIIEDWKVTSAWAVMSEKIEWEHQLNAYAFLVRSTIADGDVQGLKINAIIRDFSRRQAEKVPGYPAAPVHQVDIPLWTFEQQKDYIYGRLAAHAQALMDEPPVCTPAERWEKPPMVAVQKVGAKRAWKLVPTMEEAEPLLKAGMEAVLRPGESVRCLNYCKVRKFCDFGKSLGESDAESDQ